jgi:hypothetical protein
MRIPYVEMAVDRAEEPVGGVLGQRALAREDPQPGRRGKGIERGTRHHELRPRDTGNLIRWRSCKGSIAHDGWKVNRTAIRIPRDRPPLAVRCSCLKTAESKNYVSH